MNPLKKNKKSGAAMLITVFFFLGVSLTLAYAATIGVTTELRTYRTLASSKASYIAADAGAEDAYYRVLKSMTVSPTYTIGLMPAAATATVVYNSSDDSYDINVAAQSLEQVRRMAVHVSRNTSLPMRYAVAAGVGGIHMSNNTTISSSDGSNGDVYAQGTVTGANNSRILGDTTVGSGLDPYVASSTACVNDQILYRPSTGQWAEAAQKFTYAGASDDIIGKVDLMLKKASSPDNLTVSIYDDLNGKPGNVLATESIPHTLALTSSYQWVSVIFQSPPYLISGQDFWIVARYDGSNSASKKWFWCYGGTDTATDTLTRSGIPTGGAAGAYSVLTGDYAYRTYLGGGVSKISSVYVDGIAKADSINSVTTTGDAYYLSSSTLTSSSIGGAKHPGSPTPPRPNLPIPEATVDGWIQDAVDGGTATSGIWTTRTIGPKEVSGDVTITNNAAVTLTGTLHITGNLILSNNGSIGCSSAFGASSCLLIVDGSVSLSNNAQLFGSGNPNSFIVVYSRINGCLPTAPSPPADCASGPSGISISNNVSGAIFYAEKSSVYITNNATVTSVFGYYIDMNNNSTVIYDPKAYYITFSPSTAEIVGKYRINSWNEI